MENQDTIDNNDENHARDKKRVENNNFYKILVYVEAIDDRESLSRVSNNTQLSSNIRNAILKHLHTSSFQIVVDKENIDTSSRKSLSRFLIEIVQHRYIYVDENS